MEKENKKIYSQSDPGQSGRELYGPDTNLRDRISGRKKQRILYTILTGMTLLLGAAVTGLAYLLCGAQFAAYLRLVFLPLFAFAACFLNCLIAEKCKWMPAVVQGLCAEACLLPGVPDPAAGIFLYVLLYCVNGAIGWGIARLIHSYR